MSLSDLRVLILQPETQDGPSHLATYLAQRGVAFELRNLEQGATVPVDASPWHAVAMLGGTMSVNDPLPFLPRAEALLRDAVARDIPVLGHCLGGQLLAKALGARVVDNPNPEIGWWPVRLQPTALAREWLGSAPELTLFHWHSQTFSLPPHATALADSAACAQQAFALGPHLGMQFHVEVDAEKLQRWCAEAPPAGHPWAGLPSVMGPNAMRQASVRHLAASQRVAARIYGRWLALARARQAIACLWP